MSIDDQLDDRLNHIATNSMERRAAAVDIDAALDEHRLRLNAPNSPEGRDRRWIAAAAAVLVIAAGVAAIAWPRGGEDLDRVATQPDATNPTMTNPSMTNPSTSSPTNAATTTPPLTASAEPAIVRAGAVVDIDPAGTVQRSCLDIATLRQTADESQIVGQIVGEVWVPAPAGGTPVTYPACLGTTSDEVVTLTVPSDVPPGDYTVCITDGTDPAGCAPITITEAAEPTPETIRRPVYDSDVCETRSVGESTPSDEPPIEPWTFFAKPSEFPVPMQVFSDPELGAAGPVVLIMRFRDRPNDSLGGPDVSEITGTSILVRVTDAGIGEAVWTADDGTTGYLRSRGVDRGALVKTLLTATPRRLDAPIPGFDFFSNPEQEVTTNINGQLELTAESMNTDLSPGPWASSECTVESAGYVYRTLVFEADPVLSVAVVLDRPAPLEVGQSGDSVVIINGLASDEAPRIDDLRNATEAEWTELLGN